MRVEEKLRIGAAMCGSFCTFEKVLGVLESLAETYDVTAVLSETAAGTDTRFGKAEDHIRRLEAITGKPVMTTIPEAERIGPGKLFDVLVIAPCTGNTLGKLAAGITDTSVTMAAKAHLRNGRPVVVAMSTNDGLAASLQNIGALMVRKGYYFVPFGQDDPEKKATSLAADFTKVEQTVRAALEGRQLQPVIV
ncbi:MAG: dipicolinate synthase subunit B [Oscillospiraceae bacterium]|nr:dipicolinate synthase subunit B [Oscillospiraceae bacterium]MDD6503321.1 dipicolinate synthase subunit B [Oscillospiraceae bacterium]MDY4106031.1 dipicolinate synthase subunit B [Oscillospiraceae bacterium]